MKSAFWVAVGLGTVTALLIVGCGGGGRSTINLGDNTIVEPPIGTAAVSPSAAVFGPIANYLPPSGTAITYKLGGLLRFDGNKARLQFKSYNNTTGVMVLDLQVLDGSDVIGHRTVTLWIKIINGQSYCYRRKQVFLDEVRPFELDSFAPGILLGLFTNNPAQRSCTFTHSGHPGDSYVFIERYQGTANVIAGGESFACVISETGNFLTGDPTRMQFYWAPNTGPIMASVSPAILATQVGAGRLPWWCRLGSATAESVTATP